LVGSISSLLTRHLSSEHIPKISKRFYFGSWIFQHLSALTGTDWLLLHELKPPGSVLKILSTCQRSLIPTYLPHHPGFSNSLVFALPAAHHSTMQVSLNPPVQPVGLPPPNAELDPADPLWRHVKTEWDHQFVKRANFLPWLRAQLQIDPIDEASSAPEPLLCYVKRRFALAQNQQRLRGSANQSTSAPTDQPANAAVVQAPLNAASNAVGTSVETQASSLGAPDSCTGDTSRPGPSGSPKSEGPPATYPASEVHDQVTSDASGAPSNGILSQADVSSSSTCLTRKPTPSSSNAFSSQLGAIADAHMGHTPHITTPSSSTLSSQPNGFHYNSNSMDVVHHNIEHHHPNSFSCLSSHHQLLRLPTLTNPRSAIRHLHTSPHIPILCSPIMPTRALRHPKPCNLRIMSSFQIRTRALWSPTKTSLLIIISRLISIVPHRFLNLEIAVRRHSCK